MVTVYRDIAYGPGPRQIGDFFTVTTEVIRCPVLLIHGGGWDSLSKESLEPVARLLQTLRHPVFSINYRLLQHAPWPACGDDCLLAGSFMLSGGLASCGISQPGQIILCGASAGGHLAMMTGLCLPHDNVLRIISLAGPSRLYPTDDTSESAICTEGFLKRFFGRTTAEDDFCVKKASPLDIIQTMPPPLACIHSVNDQLVPLSHSEDAVRAWTRAGASASLHTFNGSGRQHGFWDSDDLQHRQLVPEVANHLRILFLQL